MSNNNEKIQKKRKLKKRIRGASVFIVIIYLIIRSVPSIVATNSKTVFAEEDILIESTKVSGVIIRDEMIYKTNTSGKIVSDYGEGAKISSGMEVMTVDENYKEQLQKAEDDEVLEKKEEAVVEDELNLEEFSTKDLQDMINSENFEDVHKAKRILEEREKLKVEELKENSDENIENIEPTIEEKNTSGRYFSENSGVISYYIDGFEGKYTVDSMELLSYDNLIIEKNKEAGNLLVEAGEPAYKIIDNFQWYIGLKIDNINNYKNLEVGSLVRVRIDDNPKEFASRIIHINKDKDNKAVILIRLTEGLHDFTDTRFVDVELINKKIDGLKIPNKAIVEQEKKQGVFIKDVSGVVRFKEVKVLGKDNTNTFVDKGDEKSFVEIEKDIKVKTITIFDEIFLNSNTLREGQIID